jgi:uncharacterized protein
MQLIFELQMKNIYICRYNLHTMELIGRENEVYRLNKKLQSDKAEFIAVLGRRRVGKTFLIKHVMHKNMVFQMTGLFQSTMAEHMDRFTLKLHEAYGGKYEIIKPKNWFEAFDLLRQLVEDKKTKTKKVIFLDEFPWMATNKSRFLTAFTDFWNDFAVNRNDLVVVVCGSAASWMVKNVLRNKGGLHNRVTERIFLAPFNLYETSLFLKKKHIAIPRKQVVDLYMAFGGIPYYLDQIDQGESVTKSIDRICFEANALLHMEYSELMVSLFEKPENYKKILTVLCNEPVGMNRIDLFTRCKFNSGGGFTEMLSNLEYSGFISREIPFGKSRNESLFKVTDAYILFYHKYIEKYAGKDKNIWSKLASLPTWKSWSGLAFENICKAHIDQIKKALKIEVVLSTHHSWYHKGNDEMHGAQCDLIIDRNDNTINLCELKYTQEPFVINKDYATKFENKVAAFRYFTKTNKAIFNTFLTSNGIIKNTYFERLVHINLDLNCLFEI